MPTPTQLPPPPTAAPTPTAVALPAPRWSLVLQLLRDRQVVAEGSSTDQFAAGYQSEIEREPDRYALRVLVSDGTQKTEVAVRDPLPHALFHHLEMAYVRDLDGDSRPEAIVLDFTGGAHCCSNYYIFASDASGIHTLDTLALGNGEIQRIGDLDGDGIAEIVAGDDRLALVDDIAMAATPFLPLVLCLQEDKTFSDCTARFPALVEESAAHYEELMASPENDELTRQAAAVGVYAHYARLGRPQDGLYRIASRCLECLQFVEQHRAEIDERLRQERPLHPTASP